MQAAIKVAVHSGKGRKPTMLKALFRKQWMEMNASILQNRKTGQARSKGGVVAMACLYLLVFISLAAVFLSVCMGLCQPLVDVGLSWLYFSLMSVLAVVMGVFGSVFSTFSSLYQAKDNQLLLSLPIPSRYILYVRLFGVWFWGLIYEAVVYLPALFVYGMTGEATVRSVIFGILLLILLSFFVLTLSCALGWVVAKIYARMKHRSFLSVLASLVFLCAYYLLFFQASTLLEDLLAHADEVGQSMARLYNPLYLLGQGAVGNPLALLAVAAGVAVLFALTGWIMSRSFLPMATEPEKTVRRTYRGKAVPVRQVQMALLGRERKRFTASATYMLNTGFGSLFLVILGVLALLKGASCRELFGSLFEGAETLLPALATAVVCLALCNNAITAPSVSLEGKTLWLIQSLPVSAWQVLKAKLSLHLWITGVPLLFCVLCAGIGLRLSLLETALVLLPSLLFMLCSACTGLAFNLKFPNLGWSSETVAVKQGMNMVLTMFSEWISLALLIGLFSLLHALLLLSPTLSLLLVSVILAGASAGLLLWLKRRGLSSSSGWRKPRECAEGTDEKTARALPVRFLFVKHLFPFPVRGERFPGSPIREG
jgi:ABC-2 type transport system permease protein